ncbi:MAG: ABC transporter permease [Fimbriimonas sp.]
MSFGRFEITLAIRHLMRGGTQTWLTIAAVATGVTVILFVSSLTFGLRNYAQTMISDMLPHVVVRVKKPEILPIHVEGGTVLTDREPISERALEIKDWRRTVETIRGLPQVIAATPSITDQGFASRGGKSFGLLVYGADPVELDAVTAVRKYIVQGRYAGLGVNECVVDYKLVSELGVRIDDHIRLSAPAGGSRTFRVVGLYDTGADQGFYKAFITLRAAQSLYGTGQGVRTILVRTSTVWTANSVADRIEATTPYNAASWSRDFPQSAAQFGIYDAVAYLVSSFSLVASSFAIASVLVVQVLQKGKQIGILKSIGARNRQIFMVFVLEGLVVSILGATLGALLGWGLVSFLGIFKLPPSRSGAPPDNLFPTALTPTLVTVAMAGAIIATVVAAVLPARRAALLDPVQVMR